MSEMKIVILIVLCLTVVSLSMVGCQAYTNKKYVENGYCSRANNSDSWIKCDMLSGVVIR